MDAEPDLEPPAASTPEMLRVAVVGEGFSRRLLTGSIIVSCLVHIVDLADFAAFNAIYEKKFTGVKPVRTTVRADLVAGMKVEITVIARSG